MTLADVYVDEPFAYDNGQLVRNWWKSGYKGINSLRSGITQSMNIVTVKLLTEITPQLGFDYLREFGFTTIDQARDCYQPMALGGVGGVSNLELNAAYATIANGGVYIKPKMYTKVVDSDGNVILDNTERDSHQVLKETTAFLLTDAMVDVVTKPQGTGTAVNFGGMSIAGKTGTATDSRDSWFAGYTPYYTATVWTGYDNQTPLSEAKKNPEGSLAKKLWRAVMERVHEDLPNQTFPVPGGIIQAQVCSRSGKLPIEGLCNGHIITEYFEEGTVPTEMCDVHYSGTLCAYTNLIACENCPFKIEGVTELLPIEDSSLWTGSTIITENPDGTITTTAPRTHNNCPHDAAFFADPNAYNIIEVQKAELAGRGYFF